MRIIKHVSCSDIDVEFQDKYKHVVRNTTYSNFTKGQIKNPYDITVYGVGMIGAGKYKARANEKRMTKEYVCWQHILERCYDYKQRERHPAYYHICKICDEWLNFQVFAEWYDNNFYEVPTLGRMHIDKDILYPGNKIYSPETCIFVPQRINMLFVNRPNKSGLPNGITKLKKRLFSLI